MLNKFSNLIDIKSIVTLALVSVFCVLAVKGVIEPKDFLMVVMAVITYFFAKKGSDSNGKPE